MHTEQFRTEAPEFVFLHAGHAAPMPAIEIGQKCLEAFCLHIEISCGANQLSKIAIGQGKHGFAGQPLCLFQVGNGSFDIGPVGVLGEDGADCYFKRGLSRPPMLGTKCSKKPVIQGGQ